MEFSLLFPTPVVTSGEPHRIAIRRVALLVYGKPGARLSGKEDVIEVRAPGSDAEGRALALVDGMAPVVRRFASQGHLACEPTVGGRSRVVLAAIRGGCTFIGADEDQWRIYRVLEQLAGAVTESPPPDQERPGRCCSCRPTAGYTRHPVPSVPGRGMRRVSAAPVAGLPPPLPTRRAGDDLELLEAPQARPRRQSEAPIRYLPVPHSAHTARSAGRPFFIVTRSTSRDGVLARHFRQYISVASEGVDMVSCSTGWRQSSYGQPPCSVPERYVVQL